MTEVMCPMGSIKYNYGMWSGVHLITTGHPGEGGGSVVDRCVNKKTMRKGTFQILPMLELWKLPNFLLLLLPCCFPLHVKTPESILLLDFSSVHSESLTVHFTCFHPTGIATE